MPSFGPQQDGNDTPPDTRFHPRPGLTGDTREYRRQYAQIPPQSPNICTRCKHAHDPAKGCPFKCPKCARVSHNPADGFHRYCGSCKEFFPDPISP